MPSCRSLLPARRHLLALLRTVLLALLVIAPGTLAAAAPGCPSMAATTPATQPGPPCHEMAEPASPADSDEADAPDIGGLDACCGSACGVPLAILDSPVGTASALARNSPKPRHLTQLASVTRLPEKPPPRA